MKIAITGHSAGIGQALAKIYEAQGHEVVGLSRRNGYNIRSLPKVAGMIEPCDMFINNAQVGFAQTELLFEIWRRWEGQQKIIVNISTQMTDLQIPPNREWDEYLIQKKALELAEDLLTERKFMASTDNDQTR
jgi:nucleoside-diphosphate-sugar epimerase